MGLHWGRLFNRLHRRSGLFRSNGLFRLLGLRLLFLSNDEIADAKGEQASNHEESN